MIKVLLWDIDNTLLDFTLAEENALKSAYQKCGFGECTKAMCRRFAEINAAHWEMMERGELTKAQTLEYRFREFLKEYQRDVSYAAQMNEDFEEGIKDTAALIPGGKEILQSLGHKYRQYAVTNGALDIQRCRLRKSGLDRIFDDVFISDAIRYEKPSLGFFRYVIEHIPPYAADEIMIIGDSLTSDMKGGNGIGIQCCWYNPRRLENRKGVHIDYEIHNLNEIYEILRGSCC